MQQNIEQMQAKEGFFDRDKTFDLCGKEIHFRKILPRKAKDWMALDLAEAALVFDEKLGVCYEGYTYDLALVFLMMRYYTDFDLAAYEDTDSWHTLYDLLESHGILDALQGVLSEDIQKVLKIYEKIKEAAKITFEQEHSLSYMARRMFGSLLPMEDITKTIAEAGDVNNMMVELLGAFNRLQPNKNAAGGIVSFAKKRK